MTTTVSTHRRLTHHTNNPLMTITTLIAIATPVANHSFSTDPDSYSDEDPHPRARPTRRRGSSVQCSAMQSVVDQKLNQTTPINPHASFPIYHSPCYIGPLCAGHSTGHIYYYIG